METAPIKFQIHVISYLHTGPLVLNTFLFPVPKIFSSRATCVPEALALDTFLLLTRITPKFRDFTYILLNSSEAIKG